MALNSRKREYTVEPYSKLALIYDDIMAHVDYKKWSHYIQKIIKKYHPNTKTILDISCGTGSFLLKLDSAKYQLYGFDHSFDMIKIARNKCIYHNKPISIWQGNMISYMVKDKIDCILCLYDSINYLLDVSAWKKVIDLAYSELNKNGLFIFDICSERNSIKFYKNYIERSSGFDYQYIRKSDYDFDKKIHSNNFEIMFDSDNDIYIENHKQLIISIDQVVKLISSTKFELIGFFEGFTFNQADENSLRIHFVLKKS